MRRDAPFAQEVKIQNSAATNNFLVIVKSAQWEHPALLYELYIHVKIKWLFIDNKALTFQRLPTVINGKQSTEFSGEKYYWVISLIYSDKSTNTVWQIPP